MPQCFIVDKTIPILYIPYVLGAKAVIVFAHGNGSDIGMLYQNMYILGNIAKAHIVVFDYPGYGKHKGVSTEKSVDRTLKKVYDFIVDKDGMNWPAENIFMQGNCIGCGPIARLATKFTVGGLIFQGCLKSVKDAAEKFIGGPRWRRFVVRTLVNRRWNVEKDLKKVGERGVPVLWIHGAKDTLFKPEGTQKMYDAYTGPKQLQFLQKASHYVFNWTQDICENTAKFIQKYCPDKIIPVPTLSNIPPRSYSEVAHFRNINLIPSPMKEPSCVSYRKLFKQGTIREDQSTELDVALEKQWDQKAAETDKNLDPEKKKTYWYPLESRFGSVDTLYIHLRSRMFYLIKVMIEKTPKDIKNMTVKDISKWVRGSLWDIGNPMGQLDLGFIDNKLEALHYCGIIWRKADETHLMEMVDLNFQKNPSYKIYRWIPIVSTPIVNHDKLTELIMFAAIDDNEHRKKEFREALARQWSMAALRFFGLQGVLLPHPKALIRRKSALDVPDVWDPKESLWKLLRQMSCTASDWDRLLRRIPTHFVPNDIWQLFSLEAIPAEDYSNIMNPEASVEEVFDMVAVPFDRNFADLSQQNQRSEKLPSVIKELEKSCRQTALAAGRCIASADKTWYQAAPDFLERLAHASRPIILRKSKSNSNSPTRLKGDCGGSSSSQKPPETDHSMNFLSEPEGDEIEIKGDGEPAMEAELEVDAAPKLEIEFRENNKNDRSDIGKATSLPAVPSPVSPVQSPSKRSFTPSDTDSRV